jgi:non-canonical poly(A) RNA polymerase PAPD5/7
MDNFQDGTDFIPLEPDSDTENVKNDRDQERDARKGKERERENTRDANSPPPRAASPPPASRRRRDSGSRDRRPKDSRENGQDNTREWDRGKRKYDMVFDPSDGYQNKKQRTDAKSRLAPWIDHVDWDGCENTAELCVKLFLACVFGLTPTQGFTAKSRAS